MGRGYFLYVPAMIATTVMLAGAHALPSLLASGFVLPLFAATILGLALGGGPIARLLSRPSVVFLGTASYSMYILQVPVFLWMSPHYWERLLHVRLAGLPGMAIYTGAVIIVASLVFKYVERPMNRRLRGRTSSDDHGPAAGP